MSVELAKTHFKRIFQQIQNFIDMNQIVASGPVLQVFLEEVNSSDIDYFKFYFYFFLIFKGSQDNSYFSQIFTSKRLARFALQSYLALV